MTARIVTANRLRGGEVAYLAADGGWSARIERAAVADSDSAAAALSAAAERAERGCLVVGAYLMPVRRDAAGRPQPVSPRERIRAHGPSVRPGEAIDVPL